MLVVTTVPADEAELRHELGDADEVRVVAPAARISWLDWLTNAEDDARAEAARAAEQVAEAVGDSASVHVDETSRNTDAAEDVADALRTFDADEIVVLTRSGEDADARIPGMAEHLVGCPACREEHDSLRALLD